MPAFQKTKIIMTTLSKTKLLLQSYTSTGKVAEHEASAVRMVNGTMGALASRWA